METEGDRNSHRPSPWALGMRGSTIRPTFLSFLIISSLFVKTLLLWIVNAIHLKESGSPLEGF
jgi:hypothetical protein